MHNKQPCNATMLCEKLHENVKHINLALRSFSIKGQAPPHFMPQLLSRIGGGRWLELKGNV